ncbi:hypothetical protein [Diplocloster hominis]|uniref:hypothetical protein n=1 Tax=Diplocloster hominis TaxID=3079010 RepID=UPI0031BA48A4
MITTTNSNFAELNNNLISQTIQLYGAATIPNSGAGYFALNASGNYNASLYEITDDGLMLKRAGRYLVHYHVVFPAASGATTGVARIDLQKNKTDFSIIMRSIKSYHNFLSFSSAVEISAGVSIVSDNTTLNFRRSQNYVSSAPVDTFITVTRLP